MQSAHLDLDAQNAGLFPNLFQFKGRIVIRHRLSTVIVLIACLLFLLEPASA